MVTKRVLLSALIRFCPRPSLSLTWSTAWPPVSLLPVSSNIYFYWMPGKSSLKNRIDFVIQNSHVTYLIGWKLCRSKLKIVLLSLSSECWDYRCELPSLSIAAGLKYWGLQMCSSTHIVFWPHTLSRTYFKMPSWPSLVFQPCPCSAHLWVLNLCSISPSELLCHERLVLNAPFSIKLFPIIHLSSVTWARTHVKGYRTHHIPFIILLMVNCGFRYIGTFTCVHMQHISNYF